MLWNDVVPTCFTPNFWSTSMLAPSLTMPKICNITANIFSIDALSHAEPRSHTRPRIKENLQDIGQREKQAPFGRHGGQCTSSIINHLLLESHPGATCIFCMLPNQVQFFTFHVCSASSSKYLPFRSLTNSVLTRPLQMSEWSTTSNWDAS